MVFLLNFTVPFGISLGCTWLMSSMTPFLPSLCRLHFEELSCPLFIRRVIGSNAMLFIRRVISLNVCPISLLNVINPDKTKRVPGHFIGENVAFLRDLVYYTYESGTPAAIPSLDQASARGDRPFLFRTLSCLRCGQSFVSWVQLLYTDICSAILVTGYTTDFFWPSCGVRQGCPSLLCYT